MLGYVPLATQRVLEAASVAGVRFTTATVAAGLGDDLLAVETHCEELARWQLVRVAGVVTWTDGTVVTRYAFTHALYQQVVYERLRLGHRVQVHQRLGVCLEKVCGARAVELAAELAAHFERGHDVHRAVHEKEERLLAEAQTLLETTGERWWEAKVYRLQGELL